jgi:hypothetical protein
MTSLWTDLLFLHGHCSDWRLARRLARTAPPAGDPAASAKPSGVAARHTWLHLPGLRLCLGIGDGEVHRQ